MPFSANLVAALAFVLCVWASPSTLAASPEGEPRKPVELTDTEWTSLKAALADASGAQTRLHGDQSAADSDGEPGDAFGSAIALDGDTVVVGASADTVGRNDFQGSAYVFVRSGGQWVQQAKLVAADGEPGQRFGVSVALDGDAAVVGALRVDGGDANLGSAYVFRRTGTRWRQEAKLVGFPANPQNDFGGAVAIAGDTVLVGAPAEPVGGLPQRGAVYVFTRLAPDWSFQARLVAAQDAEGQRFGTSVALSGDRVLAGAPGTDVGANVDEGVVLPFRRLTGPVTIWEPEDAIRAPNGAGNDRFGTSIAASGPTAVVGTPGRDHGMQADQGSLYVLELGATGWAVQAELVAADGSPHAALGDRVALSGDTIAAPVRVLENGDYTYAVNVFARQGSGWAQRPRLTQPARGGVGTPPLGAGPAPTGNPHPVPINVAVDGDRIMTSQLRLAVAPVEPPWSVVLAFERQGDAWVPQGSLDAGDGAARSQFGRAVALDGDIALVGAPAEAIANREFQGAAYVFERDGLTWVRQAKLIAPDGVVGAEFGDSVAISGGVAVVGAPRQAVDAGSRVGAAYVFTRDAAGWVLAAKLSPGDGAEFDFFGNAVDTDGATVIVGAFYADVGGAPDRGAAYVFERNGSTWVEQAKLIAATGAANDRFGGSVAVQGQSALVGANGVDVGADGNRGAVHVFQRSGATWTEQARLMASDGAALDLFGSALALSGNVAVVGAPGHPQSPPGRAGAYVFEWSATSWIQRARLASPGNVLRNGFGQAVAVAGDVIAVGAPFRGATPVGNPTDVIVFARRSGNWWLRETLAAEGPDSFGHAVAVDGETVLMGAPYAPAPAPYGNPEEGFAVVAALQRAFGDGFESPQP